MKTLKAEDISVGKEIAEGFFGVVYAGKLLNTDIVINIFKDTIQNIESVDKELKLIQYQYFLL